MFDRRSSVTRSLSGPKSRVNRALVANIALALGMFVIAFLINNANLKTTPLHPDETRWLNRAHYVADIDDPYGTTWQDYYIARGQPPGGSYLMGIGLWLQRKDLHANGVWDFHYGEDWNDQAGAVPSNDVLWAGRRINAVVGALVVMLVFVMGTMFINRLGGIVGGLFLAYHPLQITLSTQALSDELLALSLALSFVAAYKFYRNPRFSWALLLGVAIGIGGATKLAPLALSFALALYGVAWLAWTWHHNGRKLPGWSEGRTGLYLLLQPVIAGFVFVAAYPFLWVDPIERATALLDFRRAEMASQARIWPWAKVNNPKEAFMRYGEQLDNTSSVTRHLQQLLDRHLPFSIPDPQSYDFILVAIGALLLIRIVIRTGLWSPQALVALLMAAEVGAITVGLGVDFYRYYLPILVVNSVLVAIAVGQGWNRLSSWLAAARTSQRAGRIPITEASEDLEAAPGLV